jgi:hypothetical protein
MEPASDKLHSISTDFGSDDSCLQYILSESSKKYPVEDESKKDIYSIESATIYHCKSSGNLFWVNWMKASESKRFALKCKITWPAERSIYMSWLNLKEKGFNSYDKSSYILSQSKPNFDNSNPADNTYMNKDANKDFFLLDELNSSNYKLYLSLGFVIFISWALVIALFNCIVYRYFRVKCFKMLCKRIKRNFH